MKENRLISNRAKKLFSKAFKEGVPVEQIKKEAKNAIAIIHANGQETVTRGDLKPFEVLVLSKTIGRRRNETVDGIHPRL